MNIVCFGQQNWNVCWTAKQHLMTRLARRGHRVLYVDPHSRSRADEESTETKTARPLEQILEGVWLFHYNNREFLDARLDRWLKRRSIGRAIHDLRFASSVSVVLTPRYRWDRLGFDPLGRIYYAMDEWTAFGGLSEEIKRSFRQSEEELLRGSDIALAVSPKLLNRFTQLQSRSYLQENAADVDHFSPENLESSEPHQKISGLPRPRLGFVGQVDERLDQDLLLKISRERPGRQIVLAGRLRDGVDFSKLKSQKNIHFLGFQQYAQLPGVMREFDACLVPYRMSDLTQSCNPLKVYEYLATGLPVISRPLDGLNSTRGAISLASSNDEFISAIDRAIDDPRAGRDGRIRVAKENNWDKRAEQFEARIDEALKIGSTKGRKPMQSFAAGSMRPEHVRLDPKEDSERQLHHGFESKKLSGGHRAVFELAKIAGWFYYGARILGRIVTGKKSPLVRRILVVRRCALGDLIAMIPTLRALRRKFPEARITLGVQPEMTATEILEDSGLIDEIITLGEVGEAGAANRARSTFRLFARGFDLMITGSSYFLIRKALFSGAPRGYGIYDGHPQQNLLTRVVPLDAMRHEAENNLAIVEALGAAIEPEARIPLLELKSNLEKSWPQLTQRLRIPADAAIITIHPGSKRPSRRGPQERFGEVIQRFLELHPDIHVTITGGSNESELAERIISSLPDQLKSRVHDLIGNTNLRELQLLVHHSRLVICNDTGIMHLTRALGRPLLALLGPENDRRWGPHPGGHGPAIAIKHEVPCSPCDRWDCDVHYCMRSISTGEVIEAAERLLGEGEGRNKAVMQSRRHSWKDLKNGGFHIPSVTALTDQLNGVKQDYPNIEWKQGDIGDPKELESDFVILKPHDQLWRPGKISHDVAALVRSPRAAAADSPIVLDASDLKAHGSTPPASLLLRKDVLYDVFSRQTSL